MQIETWRLRYAEARVLIKLATGVEWIAPEDAMKYVTAYNAADALDAMAADTSADPAIARMAFVLAVALRGAL